MSRIALAALVRKAGFAACLVFAMLYVWTFGPQAQVALPQAASPVQTLALTPAPDLAVTLVKTSLTPRAAEDRFGTGPDLALGLAAALLPASPAFAVQDPARTRSLVIRPAHARPEPRAPPAA